MKLKTIIVAASPLLFIAMSAIHLNGQTGNKGETNIVWSPPNNSFSVEVPVSLKEEKTNFPSFGLFGGETAGFIFLVYVKDLPPARRVLPFEDKIDGMEFVFGGDDDDEFTEAFLTISGLRGKEIIYTNKDGKGLMIDGGDKIYILALATMSREDLNSDVANRFFSSFRLIDDKK